MTIKNKENQVGFHQFQISEELQRAIQLLHYNSPTPVQEQVIPTILMRQDVIVKSQTGSGKTASFAIPICELLRWEENKPQALVIVPTRELAVQVKDDFFHLGRFKRIKVSAIFGRAPYENQERELKQKTHVVVGTPGRIIDHLERGTIDLSMIQYLVIDEADELLRMGFIEQIAKILDSLPKERVSMLLSATMPDDIEAICLKYLRNPKVITMEEENLTVDRIEQEKYITTEEEKYLLLKDITISMNPDSCIIFCNTQEIVDKVSNKLAYTGYACDKIHGGMEQRDRLKVMNNFKLGKFRYLVATDVASRGIDIDQVSLVINYDVPRERENYVHRIGRTGRINNEGKAITLLTPKDLRHFSDIEGYIGKEVTECSNPMKEEVNEKKNAFLTKNKILPKLKENKGASLNKEIMKLHINAGKKTKMRPVDIVGTLCSIDGITADDIGIIQILDISTFVEILNNKGNTVLKELQNKPIKGRIRKVSRSDKE